MPHVSIKCGIISVGLIILYPGTLWGFKLGACTFWGCSPKVPQFGSYRGPKIATQCSRSSHECVGGYFVSVNFMELQTFLVFQSDAILLIK